MGVNGVGLERELGAAIGDCADHAGSIPCKVSIVTFKMSLKASFFKRATRLSIRLMCAVNNLFGRAKLTLRNDPSLKLWSVSLTAFGSI